MTRFRLSRRGAVAALLAVALTAGAARAETPAANYPFAVPPLELYDRLVRADLAPADAIPAADRERLAAFWAARSATPAKAVPPADDDAVALHLLASGVTDPGKRSGYLKAFNAVVAEAKTATAAAETPRDKAEALLAFLHKGAMAKGYCAGETTLCGLLDTGKYNCVSSACVYFLVGTRLGLDLRPVLIPGAGVLAGHAAVDLVDGGGRVEVEPTNPDGFDWPEKVKRPGVVVIGGPPDRKHGYDADGFGLAASIASNRGAGAKGADAVGCQVVALVLSPTDPTAGGNATAAVVNWGLDRSRAGEFEAALKVYAFGRAALGCGGQMEHNHHAVWSHYLDAVFEAGDVTAGLKLLPRAAAAFPAEKRFAGPAEWVGRAAHATANKSGWAAGMAAADAALKVLKGDDANAVCEWKSHARRLWSQDRLGKGDADGSLAVLAAGLAESPGDKHLLAGLALHTQEALRILDAKGRPAVVAHFADLRKRFPKNEDIAERGFNHAAVAVEAACKGGAFAAGLTAADGCAPLAGGRTAELKSRVYDWWARALAADGDWQAALDKYLEGMKADPKNGTLNNNVIVLIDDWAGKSMKDKDWAGAIAAYDAGLKRFPDNGHLKHNREYCRSQLDK